MRIVRVALELPLSTLFDYVLDVAVPVQIGQRVLVPFGRKQCVGVVMELTETTELPNDRLKPVIRALDDVAPLPDELLILLRFCSDYYLFPLGMTVLAALPTRLRNPEPFVLRVPQYYALSAVGRVLDPSALPSRQIVQKRLLQALQQGAQEMAALRALSASAPQKIRQMIGQGWVETATPEAAPHRFDAHHTLTDEQRVVVETVADTSGYGCFLLHGVTGSGKTEVYVHLMHHALQQGKQVLLLVPEINLTPQLEGYFRSRFPDAPLVSLHSGLADGERAQNWLSAQRGEARIVLGTRLSVFTPLPQLGLILVDEEHDGSFKQQDGLRYSARDVAIFRASQRGVPIVLGSATPSLESWHNAQSGRYRLLQLTRRAAGQAQLPAMRCINTNQTLMQDGLSPQLLTALGERLQRREQSLLFINRRGYAPVLMCTACGWLSACPHCAGKLVLHLPQRRLHCHHCGLVQRVPNGCPSCGNPDLQPVGIGTQRVEQALIEHFPEARILRVDRDSTRNKGSWAAMREQIQDDAVDILVGTQMLAKGHDFPNLTLVGVLNPDNALYSSDFRASERLFAQLIQVAGRAGRADKPGEVLIQTSFPDHPLFAALRGHDYEHWAEQMLAERRLAGFPPYVYQLLLRAEAKQADEVFDWLKRAREAAVALAQPVEIYGVVPAAMPRRAGHTRAQLLVQANTRRGLQQFARAWWPALEINANARLRWSLDIDPQEF